jgi:hypothetical protein
VARETEKENGEPAPACDIAVEPRMTGIIRTRKEKVEQKVAKDAKKKRRETTDEELNRPRISTAEESRTTRVHSL